MPEKRTYDIDARLEELRSKIPKKETKLQACIKEFLQCDDTCSKENWEFAKKKLNAIQDECMRVHGKNIWCVPEMEDALRDQCKKFRLAAIHHNLELCFDFLEQHVQNKIMIRESCNYRTEKVDPITIADYDHPSRRLDVWEPSFVGLTDLGAWKFDDGVRYEVNVISDKHRVYQNLEYFASDATIEEMGSPSYPRTVQLAQVRLWKYLDICLENSRVHRKDTLFDAIFDILEAHIQALKQNSESIQVDDHSFKTLVTDLHMF
jgi:hypothetical protein